MAKSAARADPAAPLFTRIAANLRQRIVGNQLEPGAKLPSEAELEVEFGCSRITVRQALASLHAAGLIHKVNGKGSFVTQPGDVPDLGPLTGFYEHMRARGHLAHGQTLSVREVPASAAVASALRIAPGAAMLAVASLRLVDGKPLAVGSTVGPPALVRALLALDIDQNDQMVLLESRLGHRLKTTQIETSAVRAGAERGRRLQVAADAPLLRIRFVPLDVNDQPLLYSELFFRGDRFCYRANVKR